MEAFPKIVLNLQILIYHSRYPVRNSGGEAKNSVFEHSFLGIWMLSIILESLEQSNTKENTEGK